MNDYLLLMHHGAPEGGDGDRWASYLGKLRMAGVFEGGSSIGSGVCVSRGKSVPDITRHLAGYVRVKARSLEDARSLLAGNPVFEAGGVVEIRELPRT
ncbi:MAG: hypothetical protein U0166_05410 [Acidobacteriota bacterium]